MNAFDALTEDEVLGRLEGCRSALIVCHVNPDEDTVCCAFALRLILEALGKRAFCRCPMDTPQRIRFLTEGFEPLTSPLPDGVDLVLAVDVASPGQLGPFADLLPFDLMIDHHGAGTPFAPFLLDSGAAAAGEIVYRLYKTLTDCGRIGRSPRICRLLYAAIAADCGNFKYSNTTAATLRTAAALLEEINGADDGGPDTAEISRRLFDTFPHKVILANGLASANLRLFENGRLAISVISRTDMEAAGLVPDDLSETVNIPRAVEGSEIGVMLKQTDEAPGVFRVSSRSNGQADVASVCRTFGGGGHLRAAGCTIRASSPDEAVRTAAEAFGKALVRK